MRARLWPTLAFVLLLAGCASASDLPGPRHVLFVGNSFTYYNNSLHNHYRALVRASTAGAAQDMTVRAMTLSGGHLPEHAASLAALLTSHDWDVVVLQGHSRGPIGRETAAPFREAAREFAATIREHGAEPVFFMTWAYADRPEMTTAVAEAYHRTGAELNARVVPVGLAFALAADRHPQIALITADGRHPTMAGTFLAACTFFAVLHGRSPVGIGYRAGLPAPHAAALQAVAAEVVDGPRDKPAAGRD